MISLHEISCVNTQFKVQSRFDLDIVECVVDFGESSVREIDAEENTKKQKMMKTGEC